jgi:predicted nucleotidyltransferase
MALGVLRRLSEADWAGFPDVTEGLEHRLYRAAQTARSLAELHETVKTKRYTLSRIRRIVLRAFLSLDGSDDAPRYLRVLGFNDTGAALLRRIRREAVLPVITRPAAHKELLREEASVTAQYELLCLGTPYEQDAGSEWRIGAVRR